VHRDADAAARALAAAFEAAAAPLDGGAAAAWEEPAEPASGVAAIPEPAVDPASDVDTAYEDRPGQRELAGQIADALERGGVLLAEAPTGIGKSLAYLLPAVLYALEHDARIVIATCSRSLQDQLFERDLPAVLEAAKLEVRCTRLKGKQNYVCPHALESGEAEGAAEGEVLEALRAWAAVDPDGDLDRFECDDPETFRRLRARVGADPGACTPATCRRGRECFWLRARREAQQARVLVVNHALLAVSGEIDGLLPEFDAVIVDEAHRLEGVLLSQLARRASLGRIEELLRLVGRGATARRGGGLAARLRRFALPLLVRDPGAELRAQRFAEDLDALLVRASEMRDAASALFDGLAPRDPGHEVYGARERYRRAADLLPAGLEPLEAVLVHARALARTLESLASATTATEPGSASEDLAAELEQLAGRWNALAEDLEILGDPSRPDWVYWRTAGRGGVELHGAPIEAGPHARRLVFERCRAAVLTSATLSAGGDLSFVAGRLGLGERWGVPYEPVLHPSPFALERQMRAWIHDHVGDEATVVSEVVAELHRVTGRNLLVLFTSHERLRRARMLLLGRLPAGSRMMAQEWDGTASVLSGRFRAERGAILLGVQSLWEGVDFPGGALEILVVAKLPFAVPDEPWVEARGERLRDQGRDPFRDDAVPEAVLRFRQGVGRLIRRADDRGVLVVCDPRLAGASYRKPFLRALGVEPRRESDARTLAADAARFLEGAE